MPELRQHLEVRHDRGLELRERAAFTGRPGRTSRPRHTERVTPGLGTRSPHTWSPPGEGPCGLGGAQPRRRWPEEQTASLPPVQRDTPCRGHNTRLPAHALPSGRPDAYSTLRPVPRGQACKLSCLCASPHTHVHACPTESHLQSHRVDAEHGGCWRRDTVVGEPTQEKRLHEKGPLL